MKKNPFRLLGTYIGLISGLFISYLSLNATRSVCSFLQCEKVNYIFLFLPVLAGFFIGWGMDLLLNEKK
ncbi:hypothetical protein C4569_00035 [Candidatus Parcubacteria bacterium]|nr:MAG: hypothetical protein C4569_00035 [Candidatus Parcubacteria bacterium]